MLDVMSYMSGDLPYDYAKISGHSLKACTLYAALEAEANALGRISCWQMKPKVHLFQELIEYASAFTGNSRAFWCYVDER
jgi:hypothetical protein